ncbi:FAD-dependent oxidoreductase [Sphaerisporangium krabiense]|uniref:2-polyprenyl-6-methoxyphenol hydroxylase-like FAD-dependent oxidoreductase n=1 Tax=Sphaerisporangium krabiense TaxID=763782 RepID=A0A7W8Z9I6_9ACTN|nr:FAD-dependent monooxygenase [Sphaerisporangium krabiense]MBB5629846.1 2-polyprenyl-6-methoxyphenol hydroxylase-like FAD-dependent oxidoreductase [Sphaerisporangium krabiense]GII63947.1 FAD-dependent oxidoreductase [Sphaerisporangium krabiense]
MAEVVIVGAGPVGLMLACELRLAGVRALVLERRAEIGDAPKANGLGGQIVRVLDHRGLLERFAAESGYAGPVPGFPFGSVPLRLATLTDTALHVLLLPQPRLERLLDARARELGAEIRRGHEVVALRQDATGVTLEVLAPDGTRHTVPARYAVGCDGGHSTVRELAGVAFPGTTDTEVLRIGHFTGNVTTGFFDTPGAGPLRPGWNRTPRGRVLVTSLQPGVDIVGVREAAGPPRARGALTLEEFRASVRRVLGGESPPLGEPIWLSETVSQARLAERYRAGRVFLAGDAAHLFPAGGAALNVGMTDAVNLGWKLAAVLRGAPESLLDSYHSERHPVGERTLLQTRAQAALEHAEGENGAALRELLAELFAYEAPLRHLAGVLEGSDVRYDMPGSVPDHPLLGRFVPDFALTTPGEGPAGVAALMRPARAVLVDLTGEAGLREAAGPWEDRVTVVAARAPEPPARALLVRPDGHVAFAHSGPVDEAARSGLRAALAHWFGP